MIRIKHIICELARNLSRYPGTALGSLLSLTLLFLLFDLFWVAAGTSDRFYRDLLSELKVEVFLAEDVADSSVARLIERLVDVEGVRSARLVSRDQAREELSRLVGTDLLVGYEESNPLPRSIVLAIDEDFMSSSNLLAIEKEVSQLTGDSEIYYSKRWLNKAEETKSVILQVGLVLGLLIFVTALISSANNIRLMTRARAVGFRQMLLLGAGRIFVAFPFVIEGFLLSGVAAAIGWLVIIYGRTRIRLSQIEIVYPNNEEIVIFCLVVAVLGTIAGYFGVRKLLKE